MKKTLILVLLLIGCLGAHTFANDCSTLEGNEQDLISRYESSMKKYHKFLPTESFATIVYNLKAYCCSQKKINCSESEITNLKKENYPKSPYLFDHLVDVTMRRLDGLPSLAYGKDVDPMGGKRREEINKIAADPTGVQAVTIEGLYNNYRDLHSDIIKNIEIVLNNYNTTNTGTLSLADKYNKLCEINKMIYRDIQDKQSIIVGEYSEKNSFYKKCENLTREREQRETQYVKLLMIQKSTQMLNQTTKAYTKSHFAEEKLMGLRNLITKVKDYFQTMVQQAPASKMCN